MAYPNSLPISDKSQPVVPLRAEEPSPQNRIIKTISVVALAIITAALSFLGAYYLGSASLKTLGLILLPSSVFVCALTIGLILVYRKKSPQTENVDTFTRTLPTKDQTNERDAPAPEIPPPGPAAAPVLDVPPMRAPAPAPELQPARVAAALATQPAVLAAPLPQAQPPLAALPAPQAQPPLAALPAPQAQPPMVAAAVPVPAPLPIPDPAPAGISHGRVGFPNPSARNCPYNSYGIIYAHTNRLNRLLDPRNDPHSPDFQNYKQQKIDKIKEKISVLEKEKLSIFPHGWFYAWSQDAQKHESYDLLVREIDKAQSLIRSIEEDEDTSDYQKFSRVQDILKILRGEKEGVLSEADAHLLCDFDRSGERYRIAEPCFPINEYYHLPDRNSPTLEADLRKQLYHTDWRVIRAGGNGHWWTYVRNEDNTIDEINDNRYNRRRNTISFNDFLDQWKPRAFWNTHQIYFYYNVPDPESY